MSNTSSRHRPLTGFAAGLAAAAAVLVPTLADAGAASAGGFEPPPIDLPGPTLPRVDPRFDIDPVEIPLPCYGWWCKKLLPDYVVVNDPINSKPSMYNGVVATPYYVSIDNLGITDPGDVWSTFAVRGETILAVEGVHDTYPGLHAEPVANTATVPAPLAVSYLDNAWIVHDTDGIGVGRSHGMYLRVWVTGTGSARLEVSVNDHVGVELLGSPGPINYRRPELTRSNNQVSFRV